jgi:hypothetical protein
MTERAQKVIDAAHRVVDGGVPLGKLIREGKKDPMSARVNYEYAAVIRAAVECVYPDALEQSTGTTFISWKKELLEIANELEAL